LARAQIRAITDIQIDYLRDRLQERDIGLQLSDEALDKLGEAGFDPVYGARPLKRAIQSKLENRLAQEILAGKYQAGDIVAISLVADDLVFDKGEEQASVSAA